MLKINVNKGKRYLFKTHINDMLLPREKAESMEAFQVVIEPGKSTHLHMHDDTEQLYYVISGKGHVIFINPDGRREEFDMAPQDVVHVPRNTQHQVFCTDANAPLTYLCVDGFPGGKPKAEPTWDSHYETVKKQQAQGT